MSDSLSNTGARSNKQRSPASLWYTRNISVFAFGRNTFSLIALLINRSLARVRYLTLTATHIFSLSHKVLTLPGERKKALSITNSKHFRFVSTWYIQLKHLSCKCYKLSSQNVHVTQFNVVCLSCVTERLMSVCVCLFVCNTVVECMLVSYLLCSISATVFKHIVEFAEEW